MITETISASATTLTVYVPALTPAARLRVAERAVMEAGIRYGRTPIYDGLVAAQAADLETYPGVCPVPTCTGVPGQPCTVPVRTGPFRGTDRVRDVHVARLRAGATS